MKLYSLLTLFSISFLNNNLVQCFNDAKPPSEQQHLAVDKMLSGLTCCSQINNDHENNNHNNDILKKREPITTNGVTLDLDLLKTTQIPVPKWLTDFTGITQWPGIDPPYIPLDFIDFNKIPKFQPYPQGTCPPEGRQTCSFDCYKCVEPDDVYTCPKLSQTFDDGPTSATTNLLNKFATTGQKSTFFNLGINVVSHPDIYQRMVREKHLIGTHTWSHPFLPSLSNEQIIAQIQWSIWAMNATGHHIPKWFRPPYGAIDNRIRAITRQFGLQAVLWDYDTFDWMLLDQSNTQRTEQEILRDVSQWNSKNLKIGIILEHDGALKTVQVGEKVSDLIGPDQFTVNQCVGGIDYIKTFPENLSQPRGRRHRRIRRPHSISPNKKREFIH